MFSEFVQLFMPEASRRHVLKTHPGSSPTPASPAHHTSYFSTEMPFCLFGLQYTRFLSCKGSLVSPEGGLAAGRRRLLLSENFLVEKELRP